MDRIPREQACVRLHQLSEWYQGLPPSQKTQLIQNQEQVQAFFEVQLPKSDYQALAQENALESIYPDETDLRNASNEVENPIGCY